MNRYVLAFCARRAIYTGGASSAYAVCLKSCRKLKRAGSVSVTIDRAAQVKRSPSNFMKHAFSSHMARAHKCNLYEFRSKVKVEIDSGRISVYADIKNELYKTAANQSRHLRDKLSRTGEHNEHLTGTNSPSVGATAQENDKGRGKEASKDRARLTGRSHLAVGSRQLLSLSTKARPRLSKRGTK
eukprot:6214107-Pleurochrysis_carterae.AAC.9